MSYTAINPNSGAVETREALSPRAPDVPRPQLPLGFRTDAATSVDSDRESPQMALWNLSRVAMSLRPDMNRAVHAEAVRLASQLVQEEVDKAVAEATCEAEVDLTYMSRLAAATSNAPRLILTDADRAAYAGLSHYSLPMGQADDEE